MIKPALTNRLMASPYPAFNQPVTVVNPPYRNDLLPKGMILQGNIDPKRIGQGTRSFEFVNHGVHAETLLPDAGDAPKTVDRYKHTGEFFGKFETPEDADAFVRSYGLPHFIKGQ